MKVWRCVGKLVERKNNLMRRRCWGSCFLCGENWKDIDTEWIHMVLVEDPGIKGENSRFICDGCLDNEEREGRVDFS
jgi:hypothetical protein